MTQYRAIARYGDRSKLPSVIVGDENFTEAWFGFAHESASARSSLAVDILKSRA